MKKINSKGFTLIELLAVITILGILMLVAIPAVSRTIENSRRDTFKNLADEYISTVRNAVIADELKCGTKTAASSTYQNVSATTAGTYYFLVSTKDLDTTNAYIKQQTLDLMEKGGKSSWGNNDVAGIVEWTKAANTGVTSGFKTTYKVFLIDAGNHGISTKIEEDSLSRSNVLANTGSMRLSDITTKATLISKSGAAGTECWLNS